MPTVQKIEIRDPITDVRMGSVILQPLNLVKVSERLVNDRWNLSEYVRELLVLAE